jgi:twitching motility protein PilT
MEQVSTGPVDEFLQSLADRQGSDLLLIADAPAMLRISGELVPYGEDVLTAERLRRLVAEVLPPHLLDRLDDQLEVDFSFGWGTDLRVRGHAFHQRGTVALSMRLIPRVVPTLAELGLPGDLERFAEAHDGLVLVTGPTGSGKSSTLASLVRHAAEFRPCHIVTIEDPIEYFHSNGTSVVTQREVGPDSRSFQTALRSVFREDPDIVLVGEMRDLESIEATLTIAETGHLVLATLHTNDAAQAIDRVVDVFPPDRQSQIRTQLASTLLGVVAQRLVPAVAGGRVPATEVLIANTAVRNLVREGKTEQLRNVMLTGQRSGMATLDQALDDLVARGVVTAVAADGARPSR